jgi:hypothetical protein
VLAGAPFGFSTPIFPKTGQLALHPAFLSQAAAAKSAFLGRCETNASAPASFQVDREKSEVSLTAVYRVFVVWLSVFCEVHASRHDGWSSTPLLTPQEG